jgi:hypothetical protein
MSSPCILDIVNAAEGKIDQRDAGRILREMSHRAKALAQKENIPLPDAANKVAEQVAIEEELKAYVHKRAKLFSLRAYNRVLTAARSGRGKDFADSLIEYMNEAANAGQAKSNAYLARFASILEEANVIREFKKGGPQFSKDVTTERWQLTSGLPFATNNKPAQIVAKAIREIEKEYLALVRKHGAWSQDAAGYTGPQTHNAELLRMAGYPAGKRFGKENQEVSYQTWRKFIDNDVKIDWDRTLPGADDAEKDAMLRSFHQSIYSGIHGATTEVVDPSKQLGMGSLAEKISSERLLWFADPESQWKYNQRWGNADFNQSIISEVMSFGRNIAMLQYLGPSPENTYQRAVATLREDAKSLPNAQKIGKKLGRGSMQGAYDLVSGRANSSQNPGLSAIVDAWKSITLASKGGGILFSMLGDRAFIDSGMAKLGANALHRMNVQLSRIAANTPEGRKQLASLGWLAHSFSSHINERWSNDVRPFTRLDKGVSWFFKVQGVEKVTEIHRRTAMSAASEHLGNMSNLSWDQLPIEMRVHLEGYQFNQAEWDVVRDTAFQIKHEDMTWTVIAPDRMQDIPDDVIDKMLDAEGIKLSQPNRSRKRDLLESKMGAYFADVASEMVPTPGLRERLFMTGGGQQKGTIARSVLDLFFTFKGFGMTVAMRNARSYGRLWAAGQYKSVGMQTAMLIAQTAALGYVGWAVREALKGRTPPLVTDENGELDAKQFMSVFMESLRRGGGLGIYGDYLLTSYNRDNKTFLEAVAGPVLSELDPMAALGTSTFKTVLGDQEPASFALQSLRFAESNTPFINLFYSKFILDHFFLWNLKEGLSPGVFRKTERAIGDQWRQEYYIDPVMD